MHSPTAATLEFIHLPPAASDLPLHFHATHGHAGAAFVEREGICMTRRLLIAAIAGLLVAFAGWQLGMRVFMAAPPKLDLSLAKPSARGLYRVALAPENAPVTEGPLQNFTLTVETPSGEPVAGADIGIGGGMPQHGHGLPTEPRVTAYLGDGRYRIEGFKFTMAGWWQLRFTIRSSAGEDEADFNIVL
jgi:hypothetical protein